MSGPATVACPNGHVSADQVFCSVCGTWLADPTRFGPDERPPTASTPTVVPNPAAPGRALPAAPVGGAGGAGGGNVCSYCSSELDPDTRFCEVCGYDPETGSLPAAPVVQPVLLPPVEPLTPSGSSPSTPSTPYPGSASGAVSTPSTPYPGSTSGPVPVTPSGPVGASGAPGRMLAVVTADRAYYDSQQVGEVQFPVGAPPRVIELPAGPATIGRRSRSLGTDPAVDLAIPPEDPAVSHTHASLLPADDGTWSVVDHGSTNGTYVNESPEPLAANTPRTVHPGDRIYVGAWTRITLELRAH